MRYCVFRSLNKSCGLFDISAVINNFIADVRKGGDLLKSFEQSNLVSNMSSRANYLHELFL